MPGKDTIQTTKVSLTLLLPDNAKDLNILEDSTRIEFKNVSTAKNIPIQRFRQCYFTRRTLRLLSCKQGVCEENKIKTLKAYAQSLSIIGEISEHELKLFETTEVEVCYRGNIFTGVLTPQGKQYYGCSYFKIKTIRISCCMPTAWLSVNPSLFLLQTGIINRTLGRKLCRCVPYI